ncbi:MAG: hypothetical protein ACYC6N_10760 [Pirellulaceae bacterium]
MKVKICKECGQAFSTTAAGQELMYEHMLQEHKLDATAADGAIDQAVVEERMEAAPRPLPPCH